MAQRFNTERVRRELHPDTEPHVPMISLAEVPAHDAALESPRYTILGSIHRGGMGEILLAKLDGPEGFSRKVVLKGLLSKLSEDDVSYQLFMREARLMACLDHPNIVRVFDLPVVSQKPYLAMEYVRGRNFHQVIQRAAAKGGAVPPRIALTVVAEALRGLHYAHSAKDEKGQPLGIIHRDVSPGNLLVSFFGEVKVTDFGIAKIANAPRFTGPRSIRGKARYVAPEQVHGDAATVLSDVYSAGVVLAEALMGEPLWERPSVPETLLAIVSEDREVTLGRILKRHDRVPGLASALRGALALNRHDRFASALQCAETLESIARSIGGLATPVELGLYVRSLFSDAPDVPQGDGFGLSGFPVPRFEMDEGDTDSTVVNLDPSWDIELPAATTRMRPEEPRSRVLPPPLPVTPVFPSRELVQPLQPMFELRDDGDTRIDPPPRTPLPRIKASPLPASAAVVRDPAELKEYSFAELGPAVITEEADPVAPRRAGNPRRELIPREDSPAAQRAMAVLLAGIFIGASLAIAGGAIALLLGH